MAYVIESCACPLHEPDEGSDRVLFLGPDHRGIPLEVVALERTDGDLLVIHAMPMRQKYVEALVREMRCRER